MEWEQEAVNLLVELDRQGDKAAAQEVANMIKARRAGNVYRRSDAFDQALVRLDGADKAMATRFANTYKAMGTQMQIKPNTGRDESAARGLIQGASYGTSDEIIGGARAALDVTGLGRLGDNIVGAGVKLFQGDDASERYANRIREERSERRGQNLAYYTDRERQLNRAAAEANPWTYGATEIGSGALLGAAGMVRGVGKDLIEDSVEVAGKKGTTRNATKKAIRDRAAKTGAVGGAIAGAGYADLETDGSNAYDVALSTALGGVAGGVVGRYADRALSPIGRGLGAVKSAAGEALSPTRRAARAIANDLDADGVTMAQAQKAIDEGRDRGQELVLPDVVPAARERLGASLQADGSDVKGVTDFLTARQTSQRDRVTERLMNTLGDDDLINTFEESIELAKQTARPLYEDAYKLKAKISDKSVAILQGSLGKRAYAKATDLMEADILSNDLSREVAANSEMARLHYTIQALRDIGSESGGNVTRHEKRQAQRHAKILSEDLKRNNPKFKQAQAIYADEFRNEEAVEFGSKLWNMQTRKAEAKFKAMSQAEKDNARIAFVDDVIERLGRKRDMTNQALDFDKDNIRRKMKLLFGDDVKFDDFMKSIGDEDAMAATFNRALHGSKTASNLSRGVSWGDLRDAGGTGLVAGAYFPGAAIPAMAAVGGTKYLNRQIERQAQNRLSEMLTSSDPSAMIAHLLPKRYGVSVGGINSGGAAIGGGAAAVQNQPPPRR